MFGTYNLINMIVIINVLIAMMNNSYQFISDHADMEWKFARSKLWLTYFEDSSPLPPPFNIVPSIEPVYDIMMYFIGCKKSLNELPIDRSKRKIEQQRKKVKYQDVIQKLGLF